MKISRSTGYALVAVGYIAQHYQDGAVLAQRVAKAYNIPLEYLLKILQQLVRANVLRSKRGPRGGFFLAKPAEKLRRNSLLRVSHFACPMIRSSPSPQSPPQSQGPRLVSGWARGWSLLLSVFSARGFQFSRFPCGIALPHVEPMPWPLPRQRGCSR